ncbi:hypothetical protein QP794_27315 [Paenibacillus sp. UMB7766-LJ446]|uniref:hypothetical protein n=1 Tax=Paenibacillus sp. UMB7766-LJ446 TaxID=3046313 RepID=UPI00254C48AE|nr:hypothetical protein [Paenibacillus sp. UMB7766-LJ446]MDK8193797.1 hypothetical protein [Paenibacillus sp. UMB7766-LJ446]
MAEISAILLNAGASVTPAMNDGTAPIQITATTWSKQHQELWEYLIPPQGHAQTVQGEVIRITGRVSHEVLNNGGGNWDAEYRKTGCADSAPWQWCAISSGTSPRGSRLGR